MTIIPSMKVVSTLLSFLESGLGTLNTLTDFDGGAKEGAESSAPASRSSGSEVTSLSHLRTYAYHPKVIKVAAPTAK